MSVMIRKNRRAVRERLHRRVRRKVSGSAERPRLSVYFSEKHIFAQVIDDVAGKTLVSASTKEKELSGKKANVAGAVEVGKLLAQRVKKKGIAEVVFDRGGYQYHGKVKALADAAREGGIKF